MARPPQQAPRQSRLAIHNRQRPRQAEETVPSVRVTQATRGTAKTRSAEKLKLAFLALAPFRALAILRTIAGTGPIGPPPMTPLLRSLNRPDANIAGFTNI